MELTIMEVACDFFQDALPSIAESHDMAAYHLKNCSECQEQVYLVDESILAA